jgi:hypothetical protein
MSDSCDAKASQEAHPVNTAARRTLGPFTVDDWYPVTRVAAEISADRRTGLIPDVIVVNIRPIGYPSAENLLLVAEIWSPDNDAKERADKAAAYAPA